jgi:hypothetical protein
MLERLGAELKAILPLCRLRTNSFQVEGIIVHLELPPFALKGEQPVNFIDFEQLGV